MFGRSNGKHQQMHRKFNASQYHDWIDSIWVDDDLVKSYMDVLPEYYRKRYRGWYLNSIMKAIVYFIEYPQQYSNATMDDYIAGFILRLRAITYCRYRALMHNYDGVEFREFGRLDIKRLKKQSRRLVSKLLSPIMTDGVVTTYRRFNQPISPL